MLQSVGISHPDIPHMDNTSNARITQGKAFSFAVRKIRSRLGLTQAAFASKIGCNQNTVSRYEAGKQLPSIAALEAIWKLADPADKPLAMAYLNDIFSSFDRNQQREILQAVEEGAIRKGEAPPSVLARMARVCEKYKGEPDAAELIGLAASWLETEFEMRLRSRLADNRALRKIEDE